MLDPFGDGRSGIAGGGPIGFAPAREELPDDIALAMQKILKEPPKPQSFASAGAYGGAGYGGSNRTSGDVAVMGSHDFAAATAGGTARLDSRLAHGTVVGLALAGAGTSWALAQGLGAARATPSRPASTARRARVRRISPPRSLIPITGCPPTASPSPAIISPRASTRSCSAAASRAAIASRPSTAGSRPYAAIQAQNFHTPSYSEANLNAGGFALGFNSRNATDTEANWAGASTVCCCSTPRPRSRYARGGPGRTTGSATPRSLACSRRSPARALLSMARRWRRTPRSPRPPSSIVSPTASHSSPSSTASSPPTPPHSPAPGRCDMRGNLENRLQFSSGLR
jgi:hypothetical protein